MGPLRTNRRSSHGPMGPREHPLPSVSQVRHLPNLGQIWEHQTTTKWDGGMPCGHHQTKCRLHHKGMKVGRLPTLPAGCAAPHTPPSQKGPAVPTPSLRKVMQAWEWSPGAMRDGYLIGTPCTCSIGKCLCCRAMWSWTYITESHVHPDQLV